MPCPHWPAPSVQVLLRPDLRLKADIRLADVVEGRENGQAGDRRVIEIRPASRVRHTSSDGRLV